VHGREAHSSYVTHGVNAIEYAARLVVCIRQIADRLAQSEVRDYGFTVPFSTLSTGVIHGGIAANVVPKDCVFQFDMRTLPHTSPEALYREIHAHAQDLAREMQAVDTASGIDLEWLSQTAGLAAAETDAIVRWAMQLSNSSQAGKVSYGTEAGLFQKMGVPPSFAGRATSRKRIGRMNSSRSSSWRNARNSWTGFWKRGTQRDRRRRTTQPQRRPRRR
jgi:acetylornithine deacetylase